MFSTDSYIIMLFIGANYVLVSYILCKNIYLHTKKSNDSCATFHNFSYGIVSMFGCEELQQRIIYATKGMMIRYDSQVGCHRL